MYLFTLFVFVKGCVFVLFFFVPYVASFSGLSVLSAPSVFSNVYILLISVFRSIIIRQV